MCVCDQLAGGHAERGNKKESKGSKIMGREQSPTEAVTEAGPIDGQLADLGADQEATEADAGNGASSASACVPCQLFSRFPSITVNTFKDAYAHTITNFRLATLCEEHNDLLNRVTAYNEKFVHTGAAATAQVCTVGHHIAAEAATSADEDILPNETADQAAAEEAATAAEITPVGLCGSLDPAAQPDNRHTRSKSGDAFSTMLLAHTLLHC